MRAWFFGAVLACVAGAALAQSEVPYGGGFQPDWVERPTGRDFERHYPYYAISHGMSGIADLCCTPSSDRTIACRVGFEFPQDQGFGAAAVEIAKSFRMSDESYAAFQSTPGAWLQVPITFRVLPVSRDLDDAVRQLRARTVGLCRPPEDVSSPDAETP